MSELVHENMAKAQKEQKRWYDRNARERSFQTGDQVLVLLPTSSNKLTSQWYGPYPVTKKASNVTYEVDMLDKRKRMRIFHVQKWNAPTPLSLWTDDVKEEANDPPSWKGESGIEDPVISKRLTPQQTDVAQHKIVTKGSRAIRQAPYRLAHAYREIVRQELKEMSEANIIEPSPIVLVRKKDETMRFCVDYRRLNAVSEADAYPMPRVDELIDRLGPAKYISTLDLTRGYWQVPVDPESRSMTALTTPFGLHQFRVMPFGLHGAPATFMDKVLAGLEEYAAAYIDDVAIYSDT